MAGIKFNAFKASQTYIARKAQRGLDEFLTNRVGEKALITCIEKGIWLTDHIPMQPKQQWKAKANSYLDIIEKYTNEKSYELIVPPNWKQVIEYQKGGKQWALGQLQVMREFLNS